MSEENVMNNPKQNEPDEREPRRGDGDPWQQAVSARLARLGTMSVDTSRLAAALAREIPRPQATCRDGTRGVRLRLRPLRAVAASFVLIGAIVIALVLSTSSGPVLASPAQMAQLHEELVSGKVPAMRVESIDEANKALMGQSPHCPELPGIPADHAMACCMKSVKDKKVACLLMKRQGVPVTLMVAHRGEVRSPKSPVQTRNGVVYYIQSSDKLNMVMTERQGRWVCLIGELPAERLMDVADQLRF
jgi:hypothetical protein